LAEDIAKQCEVLRAAAGNLAYYLDTTRRMNGSSLPERAEILRAEMHAVASCIRRPEDLRVLLAAARMEPAVVLQAGRFA